VKNRWNEKLIEIITNLDELGYALVGLEPSRANNPEPTSAAPGGTNGVITLTIAPEASVSDGMGKGRREREDHGTADPACFAGMTDEAMADMPETYLRYYAETGRISTDQLERALTARRGRG